jgi:flagellar motility protein MotE (MotC chaperone)
MIKLLTSPWASVPFGALLYLASTLFFWKTPLPSVLDRARAGTVLNGPSWDFTNPEADQLITELKSEKGALAVRKMQLDELESRLNAQRQELAAASSAIRKLQDDFDKSIVNIQEAEVPNLKRLAKVYAGMTPDAASTVMSQLDDTVIVKIMSFMKDSETAAILETLAKKGSAEAKRAAAISEHVRLSSASKAAPAK